LQEDVSNVTRFLETNSATDELIVGRGRDLAALLDCDMHQLRYQDSHAFSDLRVSSFAG
jgi:hypothetical protein